jgi:general stress protein 26
MTSSQHSQGTKTVSHEEAVAKLAELIKDMKFAMLTTVESDGSLRSRPMTTQQQEFDGTIWFFVQASASTARELANDQHVNLSYADIDNNKYVSVSGTAQVVRDSHKAKELWNPIFKAWFPEGLDDPNLALLKVEVDHAQYWDAPSSPVAYMLAFAKALAKGERPGDKIGENQKVDF